MNTANMVWRSRDSSWACPKDYNFSFSSLEILPYFIHLYALGQSASHKLGFGGWGRRARSTKPGIRMYFQIQVKIFFSSSAARGMLEASRSKLHRILLHRLYESEKLIFLDPNIQYGFQIQTQMWFPLPSSLMYLESPQPMESLIIQMTEEKMPEQFGPINTKGWEAQCQQVFHFYLAFLIETFRSVPKNNPKENQTGYTQICP